MMTPEDYFMAGAVIGLLIGAGGMLALRYTFGYATGHADGYALAVAHYKAEVVPHLDEAIKVADKLLDDLRTGGAL